MDDCFEDKFETKMKIVKDDVCKGQANCDLKPYSRPNGACFDVLEINDEYTFKGDFESCKKSKIVTDRGSFYEILLAVEFELEFTISGTTVQDNFIQTKSFHCKKGENKLKKKRIINLFRKNCIFCLKLYKVEALP